MKLAEDQQRVFDEVESTRDPVFITGAAGTGKSALLRHFATKGKDADYTAVVAPTGAAAINVNGTTIHNFALQSQAFGKNFSVYVPLENHRELKLKNLDVLAATKVLIIDEISMVRADFIDALDRAFRLAKKNPLEFFGGARLIMFGDLYQLPPFVEDYVLRRRERKFLRGYKDSEKSYFFMAHAFALNPVRTYSLTLQKRQASDTAEDEDFITALNQIRTGDPNTWSLNFLNSTASREDFTDAPRLFALRRNARAYNGQKLNLLEGDSKVYVAELSPDTGVWQDDEDRDPAPRFLELKVGALVMVTRNLDLNLGLVNGAFATVVNLGGDSVRIRLHRDQSMHTIEMFPFELLGYTVDNEDDGDDATAADRRKPRKLRMQTIGVFKQIPLMLAWGVTIHKAQGATLGSAVIDFSERFKDAGQAYVALSRVKKISGLKLQGTLARHHILRHTYDLLAFAKPTSQVDSGGAAHEIATVDSFSKLLEEACPGRGSSWISDVLDDYLDVLPSAQDGSGYDQKRRMQYHRDYLALAPSKFFAALAEIEPFTALSLARNIDRSVQNKPPISEALRGTLSGDYAMQYDAHESIVEFFKWRNPEDWDKRLRERVSRGEDVPLSDWLALERTNLQSISWRFEGGSQLITVEKSKRYWFEHTGLPVGQFDYESDEIVSNSDEGIRDLILHRVNQWNTRRVLEVQLVGEIDEDEARLILRYMFARPAEVIDATLNGRSFNPVEKN